MKIPPKYSGIFYHSKWSFLCLCSELDKCPFWWNKSKLRTPLRTILIHCNLIKVSHVGLPSLDSACQERGHLHLVCLWQSARHRLDTQPNAHTGKQSKEHMCRILQEANIKTKKQILVSDYSRAVGSGSSLGSCVFYVLPQLLHGFYLFQSCTKFAVNLGLP